MRYFARPADAEDFLQSVVEPASLVVFKGDDRWIKFVHLLQLMEQRV